MAARMAARHLEAFGVAGLHLRKSAGWDPESGAVAGAGDRFERRIAQADGHAAADFPARGGMTFHMRGDPPPVPGDGLVGLTRYWRIEKVALVGHADGEAVHAVFCV